jgi:hypothetical protein
MDESKRTALVKRMRVGRKKSIQEARKIYIKSSEYGIQIVLN